MKPSEFYEKHWRISDGKGNYVQPPPLSAEEKDFLDKSVEGENTYVQFFRKRRRTVQINIEYLMDGYKKFPHFFIPTNQPKLDKYGQIIEDETNPLQ